MSSKLSVLILTYEPYHYAAKDLLKREDEGNEEILEVVNYKDIDIEIWKVHYNLDLETANLPQFFDAVVLYTMDDQFQGQLRHAIKLMDKFYDKASHKLMLSNSSNNRLWIPISTRYGSQLVPKKRYLLRRIIELENQLNQAIEQIFNDFDKDKSGYIDYEEIKEASIRLELNLTHEEIAEIIQQLDKNNDQQVQLDEFRQWWKTQRHGKTGSLQSLTQKQAKALKLLDRANLQLLRELEEENQLITTNINIQVGNPLEDKVGFKFRLISDEDQEVNDAAALGNLDLDQDELVLVFKLKTKEGFDSIIAQDSFQGLVTKALAYISAKDRQLGRFLKNFMQVKYRATSEHLYAYFVIGLDLQINAFTLLDLIQPILPIMQQKGQNLELGLDTGLDFKDLFNDLTPTKVLQKGLRFYHKGIGTNGLARALQDMFSEFSSRKKILELLTVGMALGISGADFDIKFDSNPDKIEPLLHSFESIPNVNILPLNLKDFLSYPLKYRYWKKLSQDLENSFDLGAVDLLFKFQELNGKLTLRLSDFLSELNN